MLTPLQHKRFSEEIADQILALIKTGRLKPGDSLPPVREMATSLGVSGPPLREGLKILETMGFIEIQPRRKTVVKSITGTALRPPLAKVMEGDLGMVIQLLEVRKILESWAASKAGLLATDAELSDLETLYEALEKDFKGDQLGVDADVKFHMSISLASHNTVLAHISYTLMDLMWQSQKVTREIMFQKEENKRRLLQLHFSIFQAIRARSPRKARAAMLAHFEFAQKQFSEIAKSRA